MNTFFKIIKFVFYALLIVFAISMKVLAFFIGIFVGSSNKSSKGYFKEVEENGHYTGKYD